MPNCGSDWLVSTIQKSNLDLIYNREFFNPAVNIQHRDVIKQAFGSEYVGNYKNIAHFDYESCDKVFKQTWEKTNFNFTKENYSAFKIPYFFDKFFCFAFIRDVRQSLPGSRTIQVSSWYDAIYQSMLCNLDSLSDWIKDAIKKFTSENRSTYEENVFAFLLYQKILVEMCKVHGITVIEYKNLMQFDRDKLTDYLKIFENHLNVKSWVNHIVSSRKNHRRNFNSTNGEWILQKFSDLKCGT